MTLEKQTITPAQAAKLFGKSTRYIHRLREAGYVTAVERGRYPVVALIRGAVRYLQDQADRAEAKATETASTDARQRLTELTIAEREKRLLPRAELLETVEDIVDIIGAGFSCLGDRVTEDPKMRDEINKGAARILAGLRYKADELIANIDEPGPQH